MRDVALQGTYKVQALDRAFAVLDLLGENDTPLGLAQVASSLQLHKSTAHRFLMVLERHRMVERTSNGKFRLGLRLFDFGNRAIEQYDLRDRAQPHLRPWSPKPKRRPIFAFWKRHVSFTSTRSSPPVRSG